MTLKIKSCSSTVLHQIYWGSLFANLFFLILCCRTGLSSRFYGGIFFLSGVMFLGSVIIDFKSPLFKTHSRTKIQSLLVFWATLLFLFFLPLALLLGGTPSLALNQGDDRFGIEGIEYALVALFSFLLLGDAFIRRVFPQASPAGAWFLMTMALTLPLCTLVGGLEFYLRFHSPHSSSLSQLTSPPSRNYWTHQPQHYEEEGISYQFNTWGFRGKEPLPRHTPHLKKVLLLGDSLLFGKGLFEDQLFARQIEHQLDVKFKHTPWRFEILNSGLGGYGIDEIRNFYFEKLNKLNADLVILNFTLVDTNREVRYAKNNILYSKAWPEWHQDFYYASAFYRWLFSKLGFHSRFFASYKTRSIEQGFLDSLDHILEIRKDALKKGATFALINMPLMNGKEMYLKNEEVSSSAYDQRLKEWASKHHIAYINTASFFLHQPIVPFLLAYNDPHFGQKGHALLAKKLTPVFENWISLSSPLTEDPRTAF